MKDKDLLLSKLYDDNIIEYNINQQHIKISTQKNDLIGSYSLNQGFFWLSNYIWWDFEKKYGFNYEKIKDLCDTIIIGHLKRNDITTNKIFFYDMI